MRGTTPKLIKIIAADTKFAIAFLTFESIDDSRLAFARKNFSCIGTYRIEMKFGNN